MKQREQNTRSNYIDQVVYTGTPVTKNTPLPAGHAELHTHNSEIAQAVINNQVVLDGLIKNEEDLRDRVGNLEVELDGIIEASRVYLFKIDTKANASFDVDLGHARPVKEDDNFSQNWNESETIIFSNMTYSRAERKVLGNQFTYYRKGDEGSNKEFLNTLQTGSCAVKNLKEMRVHVGQNAEHEDFAEGNFLEVTKGQQTAVFKIVASSGVAGKPNKRLITLEWAMGEEFTCFFEDKYTLSSVTDASRTFDVSSVNPGQEISVVETDEFGDVIPEHHYVMGVVTSVDPSNNSVTYINQYAGGQPIDGDFIIAQFLPMGSAISGYATKEWSNETFANKNHTHGFALSGHNHDNDYSGRNHSHSYSQTSHDHNYAKKTEAPGFATKDDKGKRTLGQMPYGNSVKPTLSRGQLYWCNTTKMVLVGA
ncbi:MAG: hypothetical protein VW551_07510 [Euryarchaeota archaeon]